MKKMTRKELASHLDEIGEKLGGMKATPTKRCELSKKQVDAMHLGLAMGIAYAAMLTGGDVEPGHPTSEALDLVETACIVLTERSKND